MLGADREAVGSDELGLDADEIEDAAQVRLEMLERRRRRPCVVEAAPRQADDHALAGREALWSVCRVAEGGAGNEDAIDPRLELARQGEVVHRRPDYDRVRGQELVKDRAIGEGVERQVGKRFRCEVAVGQLRTPPGRYDLVDDGLRDGAAGAVVAVDAGVDMQDGHSCLLSMDLLPRHVK